MTTPDPESQTPPAKVLFPLGAAVIALAVLALAFLDLGPVPGVMMMVLVLMGIGLLWQGFKNLKRDRG